MVNEVKSFVRYFIDTLLGNRLQALQKSVVRS